MDYYNDIPGMGSSSDEFYFDDKGNVIYTEKFLKNRGYCCGSGCKFCGYFPKHKSGSTKWIK